MSRAAGGSDGLWRWCRHSLKVFIILFSSSSSSSSLRTHRKKWTQIKSSSCIRCIHTDGRSVCEDTFRGWLFTLTRVISPTPKALRFQVVCFVCLSAGFTDETNAPIFTNLRRRADHGPRRITLHLRISIPNPFERKIFILLTWIRLSTTKHSVEHTWVCPRPDHPQWRSCRWRSPPVWPSAPLLSCGPGLFSDDLLKHKAHF